MVVDPVTSATNAAAAAAAREFQTKVYRSIGLTLDFGLEMSFGFNVGLKHRFEQKIKSPVVQLLKEMVGGTRTHLK